MRRIFRTRLARLSRRHRRLAVSRRHWMAVAVIVAMLTGGLAPVDYYERSGRMEKKRDCPVRAQGDEDDDFDDDDENEDDWDEEE